MVPQNPNQYRKLAHSRTIGNPRFNSAGNHYKLPNCIKLSHSDFKENSQHFADLAYFIAFKLGVWHGSQLRSQRYANYLEFNFEDSILKSTDLINHYLDEARALQKDPKTMRHLFYLLIATTMSFSALAFSPDEFQTTDNDVEFADLVKRLDFNDADIRLKYKDSGTSVGMKVRRGDEKIGKWAPPNSATDPEAQVVAYTLGRFLGMRDLVVLLCLLRCSRSGARNFRTV